MSLQHPEEFVKERSDSWDEEFHPKTPPTPETPPPRDTRPLADIDFQEPVSDETFYVGMDMDKTPPKVTKRKVAKKVVVKEATKEEESV
jgi:hypothetical protein